MTKQNVIVPADAVAFAVPAAGHAASSPLLTYPPPRGGSPGYVLNAKRNNTLFLKQLEIGAAAGVAPKVNSWMESMRASSPTHAKAGSGAASTLVARPTGVVEEDVDEERRAWMVRHPSALNMFDLIMDASKGKRIVMFLDYDGTLSPIVDDPDRAFMSDAMRSAVRDVAKYFPTAIVTGRCRSKVYSFVRLSELYYAGSHGMDIKGPAQGHKFTARSPKRILFQPASQFIPMIDEVFKTLVDKTKDIPGSLVENNKFCLSVHFRCVDEKRWSDLLEQVRSVMVKYPKLRLSQGRKVLEIRPTIEWDKGKALEFLLESLGFTDCNDVVPVYIGDDRTDEDAFKVLKNRGQGFGILVSKMPKETNAAYSLQEPSEVMDFLHRLVEWKRLTLKRR